MHNPRLVVHRRVWLWALLVAGTLLLGAIAFSPQAGLVTAQGPQPQAPQAALGTGFTYQGQLKRNGAPVNGTCDGIFRVYDSVDSSGTNNVIGPPLVPVFTVTNGLFTTALDFGPGVFDGSARWLDILVACPYPSGLLTPLGPRQPLTAAPYALFSAAPWVTTGVNLSYSAGKVGIGSAAPLELLTVGSSTGNAIHLGTGDAASGAWIRNDGSNTVFSTNLGSLFLGYSGNAAKVISIGNANPGAVQIAGSAPGGSLFVGSNGKVGVGTTSPSEQLTVQTAPGNYGVVQTDGTATVGSYVGSSGGSDAGWIGTKSNHALNLFVNNGSPSMVISTTGNVGIGTTSPGARLVVRGPDTSGNTDAFRVDDSNGAPSLTVRDSGVVGVGVLLGSSTTHACYNQFFFFAACASAAEYVPSIDNGVGFAEAADLVSIAPTVSNAYDDEHSPFVVTKSIMPCDDNLLGFIVDPASGADGKKLNEHYLPLAIFGYFPAKVTLENGPIMRGDPLTSSSKPGYAMKATQACKIIGYALADADHEGTIQVFANHGESATTEVAALRARVKTQAEQIAAQQIQLATQQKQVDALTTRLDALEKAAKASSTTAPATH